MNPRVSRYRRDCRSLHVDLTTLIDDLRDSQGKKRRIRYAVDFSELFAYCARESTFREMRLFSDDNEETLRATEGAALTALFERSGGLLLFTPYVIELQSYVRMLQQRTAHDIQTEVAEAHAALLALRRSLPPRVFDRSSAGNPEMSEDELRVLEDHGGKIMALVRRRYERAEQRLTRLLTRNLFGDTDTLLPPDTPPDEKVVDRWFRYLRKAREGRPSGSSYLDAVAAGLLSTCLSRWQKEGLRVRLVTRSRHMVTLGDNEFVAGLWPYRPVVHSRVFSLLPIVSSTTAKSDGIDALEKLAHSLNVFLMSYQELRARPTTAFGLALERAGALEQASVNDVDAAIDDIKRQWRARLQLVSSMGGSTFEDPKSADEPMLNLVRAVVTDTTALHRLISRRLEELLENVGTQNQFLGLTLHESTHSPEDLARRHLSYEVHGRKLVLSSNLYWMPCTLQFSSSDLANLTAGFVEGRRLSAEDMLRALRHHTNATMDYERMLSMAYLAGCWRLWDVANIYCDLALHDSRPEHHRDQMHEGYFFKAVCLRTTAHTENDYQLALDYLAGAVARKALVREQHYKDPRYLKEEATIILSWHSRYPVNEVPRPEIEHAVTIAEQALSTADNDVWLKAGLLNNLCYFFADRSEPTDLTRATDYYRRFAEALKPIGSDPWSWPPNYIDTMAWTRYKLRFDNEPAALCGMLEIALQLPLDEKNKIAIETHLKTIRHAA
ncbi:MAG TPA: hypothetical protein VH417_06135 [Vicinamibacterales bacterium]